MHCSRGGLRSLGPSLPLSPPACLQSLIKDLLRFWMVDIPREGHGETQGAGTRPARVGTGAGDGEEKVHAPDWCGRKLRLGPRGEKVYCTRGECALQAPGCLSHSTGKAQNAGAAFCSALFWNTQGLEPRAAQGTLHIEQPGA